MKCHSAERHFVKCHSAERHSVQCPSAECNGFLDEKCQFNAWVGRACNNAFESKSKILSEKQFFKRWENSKNFLLCWPYRDHAIFGQSIKIILFLL
jgi:hypothetical protein